MDNLLPIAQSALGAAFKMQQTLFHQLSFKAKYNARDMKGERLSPLLFKLEQLLPSLVVKGVSRRRIDRFRGRNPNPILPFNETTLEP